MCQFQEFLFSSSFSYEDTAKLGEGITWETIKLKVKDVRNNDSSVVINVKKLNPGTEYTFGLAFNAKFGHSKFSNLKVVQTKSASEPRNIKVKNQSNDHIELVWEKPYLIAAEILHYNVFMFGKYFMNVCNLKRIVLSKKYYLE